MKNPQISIVIVNYRVERELLDCIVSIEQAKKTISYEVIVVDNSQKSLLKTTLKKFKHVRYVKSPKNLGFGAGNNLGAKYAAGEYLFFLNPDTIVTDKAIEGLYKFIRSDKNIGIVSPLLTDSRLAPFETQSGKELTPLNAIYSFSFLRKFFPKESIYNDDFFRNWDQKLPIEVDTVPGAALMISRKLFRKIRGFDERFFLYFEENDLSKRIKNLGYKLFIYPSSKIVHMVGQSTKQIKGKEDIFAKSRFYYLKKHYGLISAFFAEFLMSLNKQNLPLILILAFSALLRLYNIEKLMPFIGDQGWFYLSARDMILNGQIPLVGIASSHPWLHQGPLWTYMLSGVFWIFGFNPINGAYLTIVLGIFAVFLVYRFGSEMFSRRVSVISALLYAASPLAVIHSRTPYHTSPIPLFTLFYIFSLYKFVKGNSIFFPLSLFSLSVLYNLELAASVLWFILIFILIYGIWKKTEWVKKIFDKKILILSILAFAVPMLPILIYDFYNNFPQTIGFVVWIGYRVLKFFGFPSIHGGIDSMNFDSMIASSFYFYQYLIFAKSNIAAFIILIISFGAFFLNIYNLAQKKKHDVGFVLLALWVIISLSGYFVNKTPSEAYLPILFPALIYLAAFSFDKIMNIKVFSLIVILMLVFISAVNSYALISSDYFTGKLNFSKRVSIAKEIVKKASGREYNILGIGNGSQFESFTMNYEYLTWRLGHAPSKFPQKLKYTVYENEKGVQLLENE